MDLWPDRSNASITRARETDGTLSLEQTFSRSNPYGGNSSTPIKEIRILPASMNPRSAHTLAVAATTFWSVSGPVQTGPAVRSRPVRPQEGQDPARGTTTSTYLLPHPAQLET